MKTLKHLPFFQDISDSQLAALMPHCQSVALQQGQPVPIEQGQTDAYWFLLDGKWKVERRVAGDWQVMFEADRAGTWTGGIPVIDAIAPVRATAMQSSQLIKVDISAMQRLVGQNPKIAQQLLKAVHWGSDHIGTLLN